MRPVPAPFAVPAAILPKWEARRDSCSCPLELGQVKQAFNGPISTLTQLGLPRAVRLMVEESFEVGRRARA